MESALGAVGVMLEEVRNKRNKILIGQDGRTESLERRHLGNFCMHLQGWKGKAGTKLKQWLSGRPTQADVGLFAPELLRFVLLGAPGETAIPRDVPKEVHAAADQIVRVFFANCPYVQNPDEAARLACRGVVPKGGWYFWPFARKEERCLHIRHTFTSAEDLLELGWLRREVTEGRATNARMTYVFPRDAFRLVDMTRGVGRSRARLTDAGEEALRCLHAGIEQVLVYPHGNTFSKDPEKTAKAFCEWVQRRRKIEKWPIETGRLHLVAVKCTALARGAAGKRRRFGWEHLVPHENVSYYEWVGNGEREERLSYMRGPEHGPCTFEPDDSERGEFRDWLDRFVFSRIDTSRRRAARNDRPVAKHPMRLGAIDTSHKP